MNQPVTEDAIEQRLDEAHVMAINLRNLDYSADDLDDLRAELEEIQSLIESLDEANDAAGTHLWKRRFRA